MGFEIDQQSGVITIVVWIIIVAIVWKLNVMGDVGVLWYIMFSILSLPAFYFIIARQLNQ